MSVIKHMTVMALLVIALVGVSPVQADNHDWNPSAPLEQVEDGPEGHAAAPVHEGALQEDASHDGEHAKGEHHESGGLPQLNVETFPSQIFWTIVAFAAMLHLMSKDGLPVVREVLQQREWRITSELDKADGERRKAQSLQSDHESRVRDAREEAQTKLKDVTAAMRKEHEDQMTALGTELDADLAKATKRIADQKRKALQDVGQRMPDLVSKSVQAVAGVTLAPAQVSEAMNKLQKSTSGEAA